MKVWLAFEGEYEGRCPYAAFTTKELAEADYNERFGPQRIPGTGSRWGTEEQFYPPDVEEIELKA